MFVDANAISPERARAIASAVDAAGMRYVDGGIIGGPPTTQRPTAVYLSGAGGDEIVDMLATPEIQVTWLGPEPAAASAIKMAYAAWTKGTTALVIAIRAMARAEGVEDALDRRVAALATGRVGLVEPRAGDGRQGVAVGRRDGGDRRVARDRRCSAGAFDAAAQIYERLDAYKDVVKPPPLDEMIDRILNGGRLEA